SVVVAEDEARGRWPIALAERLERDEGDLDLVVEEAALDGDGRVRAGRVRELRKEKRLVAGPRLAGVRREVQARGDVMIAEIDRNHEVARRNGDACRGRSRVDAVPERLPAVGQDEGDRIAGPEVHGVDAAVPIAGD